MEIFTLGFAFYLLNVTGGRGKGEKWKIDQLISPSNGAKKLQYKKVDKFPRLQAFHLLYIGLCVEEKRH
jgi:hypothetical protein